MTNRKLHRRISSQIAIVLVLASGAAYGQNFTKVIAGPLVTTPGDSRSVNWVDVNNDGFVDCMITNGPASGQNNMLYLNDGSGGFAAVTGSPIVVDGMPSDGATWADTDNDGDLDCYVVNWYNTKNLFYLNSGPGTFTSDTASVINTSGGYCETASWGDYDQDGKVDLYVTNSGGANKNLLFHNDGGNSFTRITSGAVANDVSDSRSVNWTDMDNDGDLDLFVTNESSANEFIYRNDDSGFVRITTGPIVNGGGHTMTSSWGDYDNDGDLDVFIGNDRSLNALYRNDGNFTFTLVASDTISKTIGRSFSSAWSDIDNDGDLDLYVTNSFGTSLQVNFMYLNNGGSFTRLGTTVPVLDSSWSYGCAFGDYDNDGFEDLAVATCRVSGLDRPDLLYHNNGNGNKWIAIRLTGTTSNRSAIGARVRLKATINGNPVWQMREISAQSGYCSQNDMRAHFGIGNASVIDSIRIEWPSGMKESYVNVSPNQILKLTEGQTVGVKSAALALDIVIYPNPSKAAIVVATKGWRLETGDEISVTDASGRLIYSEQVAHPTGVIRIDRILAPGQYTISVRTREGMLVRKITRW